MHLFIRWNVNICRFYPKFKVKKKFYLRETKMSSFAEMPDLLMTSQYDQQLQPWLDVSLSLWPTDSAEVQPNPNLSPCLSVLPSSLIYCCVCVHTGTRPEWSIWRRSCQRPVDCWPSRKPRSCPSRRSTGRLTHTRRWLSSELKHWEDKGKAPLAWNELLSLARCCNIVFCFIFKTIFSVFH